jgi:glycerol-3-phosphate acyltransferase PlsX
MTKAVAAGDADAFVCGGSTGAAVAAALFNVKRARGIFRPALALPLPIPGAHVTLLDVGANVEVRPEHLVQFAFMGAAFAHRVLEVERPRVALLSNGEEPTKGTPDVLEAHGQLAERAADAPDMEFVGNIEGTMLTEGAADVVVTDGFTGNVALKLIEGVSQTLFRAIRDVAEASPRAKAGGLPHARLAARAARRPRPRGRGRRVRPRPEEDRDRPPRAFHPLRHLAGHRRGRARRAGAGRRTHSGGARSGRRAAHEPVRNPG